MTTIAGLEITTPEALFEKTGICLGIYGKSGVGKTTLIGTIAKSKHAGRVLWVDCKGGSHVLAGQNLPIDVVLPDNFLKLDMLNKQLLANPQHQTYVFDHVTHMQKMHLDQLSSANSREWKHYTRSQEWLQKYLTDPWIKASDERGINVVFVFQEDKDQEEDTKRWITRLNLTPHVAMDLPYYLDYVGYIGLVKEGGDERFLSFAPSQKYSTKTRRPLTGVGSDIPKVIYHPDLSVLLNTLKGDHAWPTSYNTPRSKPEENKLEETREDGKD